MFFGSSQVIENMERETGIEPATSSLGSWHSTAELLPRSWIVRYLTVRHGFSCFHCQPTLARKPIQINGFNRKTNTKSWAESCAK